MAIRRSQGYEQTKLMAAGSHTHTPAPQTGKKGHFYDSRDNIEKKPIGEEFLVSTPRPNKQL